MKKVLIVFDGTHFSTSSLNFANYLNSQQPIMLTGVFLPQTDFANLWSYGAGAANGGTFIPLVEDIDAEVIQRNIETFSKYCVKNNIEFKVHADVMDFAIPELTRETRFADLMLVESQKFYSNAGSTEQNAYLQQTLSQSECPVIVIPENVSDIKSLVLAYDGTGSSVYAIRQFAYLFPELTVLPATVLYVNEKGKDIPEQVNIEELVVRHYSNLTLMKLDFDAKKYFSTWISERKGALLITGSYGRSGWSRLFKTSFVSDVIDEHQVPVFVAHS